MKHYKIPEVRIGYGWLLASVTAESLNDKFGDGTQLGTDELFSEVAVKYSSWWKEYEEKILKGICSILDLEYRQNIIDVYVSPWFSPISDPMVIGPAFNTRDSLINTLTHELIHRLLTDNTSNEYGRDLLVQWRKLFGENHDWNTLIHIPVHATMKSLYLDTLDRPDLLELDIKETSDNKPYADAWAYVEAKEYRTIINGLLNHKNA